MNDNVRKIFDILGVEPNEHFRVSILGVETDSKPDNYTPLNDVYYIDENLFVYREGSCKSLPRALRPLLAGEAAIIKLPKKKKLRDLTPEEFDKLPCEECQSCIFYNVPCNSNNNRCWINHKDLYSDKFLDQEIEVEE